jgi:DNA-binding NarL/FixJ family response regulator
MKSESITSVSSAFSPAFRVKQIRPSRAKQRAGWLRFEERFRWKHRSFLHELAKTYPKLSPTELEICAMLRESLPSREIAEILFICERSVENHRCNIRRKLSLRPDQNLQIFLIGF